MNEIRTPLGEKLFTQICKTGYLPHGTGYLATDVRFTSPDMKLLAQGQILEKVENGQIFKYALEDIGLDLIKEILKRSPLYSELYYDTELWS